MMESAEAIRDMEHKHIRMSYNRITDLIYAGNNMCCQGHFSEELLSKGISADISLEDDRLDEPRGIKYFFWYPWKEDTAPSAELINLALNTLESLVSRNIKTYIHCKNGHGRTTTFLAAYFIHAGNISPEEALKMVLERRPSAHLNEIQIAFLKEYAKNMLNKQGRYQGYRHLADNTAE
jgi:protein-tyrosine phosphatase